MAKLDLAIEAGDRKRMNASADDLCFGDVICLWSDEHWGYVYATQSSRPFNQLAVAKGTHSDKQRPSIDCLHAIQFEVLAQNRYKAWKRVRDMNPNDDHYQLANAVADAEVQDNEAEQRRQRAKPVIYGQTIQLRHVFTGKYVHVSTRQTSYTESSNLLVELKQENSKRAQFRILPRYKVKSEGDLVQVGDLIMLESVKSPGQFLNNSRVKFPSSVLYNKSYELNLSVNASGFGAVLYSKAEPTLDDAKQSSIFTAGSLVQLYHKETEAYLAAEGVFHSIHPEKQDAVENVHLRSRRVDDDKPDTMRMPTSAIVCWTIERADHKGAFSGARIKWLDEVRLQHITTRQFITLSGAGNIGLTHNRDDHKNMFLIYPVSKRGEHVENKNLVRFQHVHTGKWLHASGDQYERGKRRPHTSADEQHNDTVWSKAQLNQVKGDAKMHEYDAFVISRVPDALQRHIFYASGMVPFLQKLLNEMLHEDTSFAGPRQAGKVMMALEELKAFINVTPTQKDAQKLLRNFMIVDLLVKILRKHDFADEQSKQFISEVHALCYDILRRYLEGQSRKNELYLAKHLEFFRDQLSFTGKVGLNAADMLVELLRDNKEVIGRIEKDEIDMFIMLMLTKRNYRYLDLLRVLCVSEDIPLLGNQKHIAHQCLGKWVNEGKEIVYFFEFGSNIHLERDEMYVSINKDGPWTKLRDIVEMKGRHSEEEYLYLEHQLKLYSALAKGRCRVALEHITKDGRLMDFHRSLHMLQMEFNSTFGDRLRAVVAENIVDLFIDVHGNYAVMDRVSLVFDYDTHVAPGQHAVGRTKSKFSDVVRLENGQQLQQWIAQFLDNEITMIDTDDMQEHYKFVAKVLRLVYTLINFGYYGDTDRIQKLVEPILSLVNGRNDLPRKPDTSKDYADKNSLKLSQERERYQQKDRFDTKNAAMNEAKSEGLRVLGLFFNFRFQTQMKSFVSEYKKVHEQQGKSSHALEVFTRLDMKDEDFRNNERLHRIAITELDKMHETAEKPEFRTEFIQTLQDLMNYADVRVVTQALMLLNKYFCSTESLFLKCIETQLLKTTKSKSIHEKITTTLPHFLQLSSAEQQASTQNKLSNLIDEFIPMCCLDASLRQAHPINQEMLYNCGILSTVMDLLKPFSGRTHEIKHDERVLLEQCLLFLKVFVRGNRTVKRRLFNRLDFLLSLKGAEKELTSVIIEIFANELTLCLKIKPKSLLTLVRLYKASLHSVWLSVISHLVVCDSFPLKRNQNITVKALMSFPETMEVLTLTDSRQRLHLVKDIVAGDTGSPGYQLCALLHLFSMCAYGENKSIESICQCLMNMNELLTLVNIDGLQPGVRLALLLFLTESYLMSSSPAAKDELSKYLHDSHMRQLINTLIGDLHAANKLLASDPGECADMLRRRPQTLHREGDRHQNKELLHYIFDAVCPFIKVVFERYHSGDEHSGSGQLDMRLRPNTVAQLLTELEQFARLAQPVISITKHRVDLSYALYRCAEANGTEVAYTQLIKQLSIKSTEHILTKEQIEYQKFYAEEIELNEQFDRFASNMLAAYEGRNSVRIQLGVNSNEPYFDDPSNSIPLGEEFQQLVACFRSKAKTPYRRNSKRMSVPNTLIPYDMPDDTPYVVKGLVSHLIGSSQMNYSNEEERIEMLALDKKALQVLRAIIHNEFMHVPVTRSHDDYEAAAGHVQHVQQSLDEQGVAMAVLPHLTGREDDGLVRKCFNVFYQLYRSNDSTPASFVKSINQMQEESFFMAVQNRLQHASALIKERRFLLDQQEQVQNEARQLHAAQQGRRMQRTEETKLSFVNALYEGRALSRKGSKQSALANGSLDGTDESLEMSRLNSAASYNHEDDQKSLMSRSPSAKSILSHKSQQQPKERKPTTAHHTSEAAKLSFDGEFAVVVVILKTIQALCDLEFNDAQHLLREQDRNVKSVNLVSELCNFMSVLFSNVDGANNRNNIMLLCELLETLMEVVQGNTSNQAVVFDRKVVDHINHLLGSFDEYADRAPVKDVLRLHLAISSLLDLLTEENQRREMAHMSLSKTVMSIANKEAMQQMATICFKIGGVAKKEKNKQPGAQDCELDPLLESPAHSSTDALSGQQFDWAERELALSIGFQYYHLLRRASDLQLFNMEEFELDNPLAAQHYYKHTCSVEVLRKNILQRIYFRVEPAMIASLRDDVVDKMKWNIDRSSKGNKMRDFAIWIKDIIQDMRYQRKVNNSFLGRMFVKNWKPLNLLLILLTVFLNFMMIISWDVEHKQSGWLYHKIEYNIPWRVCGVVHNILSISLVLSYFLSNIAGFVSSLTSYKARVLRIQFWIKQRILPSSGYREPLHTRSKVEVNIFGGKSLYYVMFIVLSLMGTIVSPSFFAFHLLQIINMEQLLTRVIMAVTVPSKSLLWVALLACVIIYIYGLAGFLALRPVFQGNLHFCDSLLECTASMFREGLVYRTMRIDYPVKVDPSVVDVEASDFSLYSWKLLWDLSFFVLVLTIGLNVIFGIIVDTFRQLRDEQWRIENDNRTRCFICFRNGFEFDQKKVGFRTHTTLEHNQQWYILFFARLSEMPPEDMKHMEMYIKELQDKSDYNYFPLDRAMSLGEEDGVSEEHKNDLLIMQQLQALTIAINKEQEARATDMRVLQQQLSARHNSSSTVSTSDVHVHR